MPKDELISKLTAIDTDFQAVSRQHLNFEIEILFQRGYNKIITLKFKYIQ